MGYACPVCDAPQADGEHLANHVAFTAMLHEGDEHAAFLDDHVPDWSERTPGELSAELVFHADEVAHETVFEDTTGAGQAGDASTGGSPEPGRPAPEEVAAGLDDLVGGTVDEETRRVVEEARKLFERGGDREDEPDDRDATED